ncbi:hypothetical protein C8R47DRAFT_1074641 [Mycena vitilis]|nr:hypothetical protein C8R47DRAFT_1074641 [Mycena vitilis]
MHDINNHIHRHVLLYPQEEGFRRSSCWFLEGPIPTLASVGKCISWSPDQCRKCPKPSLTYSSLAPGFSFTILISCPHHPDAHSHLLPNQSVLRILPEGHKSKVFRGNLWIVKHKAPDGACPHMSNKRLPVVDFEDADLPYMNEMMGRRISRIESAINVSIFVGCIHNSIHNVHPQPSPPDSDTPIPVFDIDSDSNSDHNSDVAEAIANLTLGGNTIHLAHAPQTPPPAYEHLPLPTRAYIFNSPRRSGPKPLKRPKDRQIPMCEPYTDLVRRPDPPQLTSFFVAVPSASATLGTSSFLSRQPSDFLPRQQVQADTVGVRFSLHQGYRNVDDARAAFDIAHANGWTCTSSEWKSTPISRSCAPLPVTQEHQHPPLCPRLSAHIEGDACVECALNVLGISGAVHHRARSYTEALAHFQRALDRGEVHVRRARVV